MTSLVGLSLVLVLVASAVDAVVWTYQSQRRLWRESAAEGVRRTSSWREARKPRWAPAAVRPAPDEAPAHRHGSLRCVLEPARDGVHSTVRCFDN